MVNSLGELLFNNSSLMLKMWSIYVKPGRRDFLRHSHTRFEITVVNSGSGEYSTLNKVYPMCAGDVFVFSSNEVHCITKAGPEGLSITNLHFEPRYIASKSFDDVGGNVNFCFSHSPEFENRIPGCEAEIIRNNHLMIKQELTAENYEYQAAIKAHLNLILVDLMRNHKYRQGDERDRTANLFGILSVYDYIDAHLTENITLGQLSQIANLSPNYFSHVFKELSGISLWDYITTRRVELARHLICSDDSKCSMLDIALKCGFNNTANFNKAFKKCSGYTPSELRKNPKLLYH